MRIYKNIISSANLKDTAEMVRTQKGSLKSIGDQPLFCIYFFFFLFFFKENLHKYLLSDCSQPFPSQFSSRAIFTQNAITGSSIG